MIDPEIARRREGGPGRGEDTALDLARAGQVARPRQGEAAGLEIEAREAVAARQGQDAGAGLGERPGAADIVAPRVGGVEAGARPPVVLGRRRVHGDGGVGGQRRVAVGGPVQVEPRPAVAVVHDHARRQRGRAQDLVDLSEVEIGKPRGEEVAGLGRDAHRLAARGDARQAVGQPARPVRLVDRAVAEAVGRAAGRLLGDGLARTREGGDHRAAHRGGGIVESGAVRDVDGRVEVGGDGPFADHPAGDDVEGIVHPVHDPMLAVLAGARQDLLVALGEDVGEPERLREALGGVAARQGAAAAGDGGLDVLVDQEGPRVVEEVLGDGALIAGGVVDRPAEAVGIAVGKAPRGETAEGRAGDPGGVVGGVICPRRTPVGGRAGRHDVPDGLKVRVDDVLTVRADIGETAQQAVDARHPRRRRRDIRITTRLTRI
ncbi:hypothetical protein CHKEEEPN_0817 [Methylorubrum podarium]|nr:hypothetical protein CHKEEEPN_0817 [Methylorubrum podarium]